MTLDANVLLTSPRLPDPMISGVLKASRVGKAAEETRGEGVFETIQAQNKHTEGDRRPVRGESTGEVVSQIYNITGNRRV